MNSTSADVLHRQIHLLQLTAALQRLAAVQPQRESAPALPGHRWERLGASCIQCGITLTPQELACLAQNTGPGDSPDSPRVERIRKGYCARRACDSYYYDLAATPEQFAEIDALLNAAGVAIDDRSVSTAPGLLPGLWLSLTDRYNTRELLTLTSLVTLISLLIWWHFRTPAWATHPSGYQIDPMALQSSRPP
jgi:hypothetical protein